MSEPGPIIQSMDTDGCSWTCPCGVGIYTSDGRAYEADRRRLSSFMRDHAGHSDGTIAAHVTADGARQVAVAGKLKPRWIADEFPA